MFRRKFFGKTMFFIVLALAICGNIYAKNPIKIKLSHSSPLTQSQGIVGEYFKKLVEERSKGSIIVEHYPQCVLSAGNDTRQLEMVIQGTIEMCMETSAKYAFLEPRVEVISLPFIFKDMDHYYAALESPTALAPISENLEKKGMHVVRWHPRVPRQLMNNVRPIRTPEDIAGLRIRTMSGPVFIQTFSALGASPTPTAWAEVYTALELNVVDGFEPDFFSYMNQKFFEVAEYVTKWDYSMDAFLEVYNKRFWNSLSKENQELLEQASADAYEYAKKIAVEMDEKALNDMYDLGLQVEILTPEEKAAFAEITRPVWDEFAKKHGEEIVNSIIDLGK